MTSLFIGLVSHEKSRFASNQGPEGLTQTLAARLGDLGVTTTWRVNTDDAYDPAALPIDGSVAWARSPRNYGSRAAGSAISEPGGLRAA